MSSHQPDTNRFTTDSLYAYTLQGPNSLYYHYLATCRCLLLIVNARQHRAADVCKRVYTDVDRTHTTGPRPVAGKPLEAHRQRLVGAGTADNPRDMPDTPDHSHQ